MGNTGKVIAVCISENKGTQKTEVPSIKLIPGWGIEGDAHAGSWHRQVSLLAFEEIEDFRARGANVDFGAFGENLIVEGIGTPLKVLPVGAHLQLGDILLEVTQIGKKCHDHCAIYDAVGDCIMPREGIFARVLRGGQLRRGAPIVIAD